MPSSSVSLQACVDHALRFGDIKPVLQTGGSSQEPALSIANQVMMELCAKKFNWKFNSFLIPPFQTISWQNDYAVPGITTLGWLENGVAIDINSTQIPKRKFLLEVVRDLQPTSLSGGRPFQVCWLPNSLLQYGTWGAGLNTPNTDNTGQTDPGPNVVYTQPLGATTTPSNPSTQIIDPSGNLQVVNWAGMVGSTTYTCGPFAPSWPSAKAPVGTVTTDGTVQWIVVDPYGQGMRLQLIPSQAGVVWQIMLRAQSKPTRFTSLQQFINPVPDDFSEYFKQGFVAFCYQRSPEAAIRAKFPGEFQLWQKALMDSQEQANRETESFAAYPSDEITGGWDAFTGPRPDWPFSSPY